MSTDDLISSGKEFAKQLTKFVKSRAMVYTTIATSLGIGGWGYADIKQHINNIESIPEYRQKVDKTIKRMDSTTIEIRRSVVPLLIISDSLPAMIEHMEHVEYRVNENMDLIDMMYEDFYEFKYQTEQRLRNLGQN